MQVHRWAKKKIATSLELIIRIIHANFGVNRINSLGARAAWVGNEQNTALLPGDAVMQMISLKAKARLFRSLKAEAKASSLKIPASWSQRRLQPMFGTVSTDHSHEMSYCRSIKSYVHVLSMFANFTGWSQTWTLIAHEHFLTVTVAYLLTPKIPTLIAGEMLWFVEMQTFTAANISWSTVCCLSVCFCGNWWHHFDTTNDTSRQCNDQGIGKVNLAIFLQLH